MNNPYYQTDAGQQQYQGNQQPYMGQPQNQPQNQPGNVQINIGTRNPPPPPAGGRNHHLGGVHIHIGDYPIDVRKCPRCACETETVCRYKFGSLVWIMCLVLFCFSVCLFWVPFCID